MYISFLYLVCLIIAPQLWLKPFVGVPTDIILLPVWLLVLLIKGEIFKNGVKTQDKFLSFFVIWVGVSMAVNGNLLAQDRDMGYLIILYVKFAVLYFFIIWSLQSEDRWKYFIVFFVCLSLILSIEGIQHKLTGLGWAGQTLGWVDPAVLEAGGTGRIRWVGIFDGPGVFCVVYTIALPFLLIGFNVAFSKVVRILCAVALPLVLIAIFFNGSRGGLVTTFIIFLIHFLWNFKKSKISIIIGICITLIFLFLPPSHMIELNDSSKSSYHRIAMWFEGFEMVSQNPVFGIGRGNFKSYTSKLIAHNSAVEIMGETGFVGLFAWVGFVYMSFKGLLLYMNEESSPKNRLLARGLFISIMGYIISSMFVTLEYETYYILLAIAAVVGRKVKGEFNLTKLDLKLVAIICAGFATMIYLTTRWYAAIYF